MKRFFQTFFIILVGMVLVLGFIALGGYGLHRLAIATDSPFPSLGIMLVLVAAMVAGIDALSRE